MSFRKCQEMSGNELKEISFQNEPPDKIDNSEELNDES